MSGKPSPLWKCPRCGHRFVTRNLWHSCVRVRPADHFAGRPPVLHASFDRVRAEVRACGPGAALSDLIGRAYGEARTPGTSAAGLLG